MPQQVVLLLPKHKAPIKQKRFVPSLPYSNRTRASGFKKNPKDWTNPLLKSFEPKKGEGLKYAAFIDKFTKQQEEIKKKDIDKARKKMTNTCE